MRETEESGEARAERVKARRPNRAGRDKGGLPEVRRILNGCRE